MSRTICGFVAALCLVAIPASTLQAQATPGGHWRDDVGEYARRLTDAGRVPGLSVAVVVDDRVLFAEGFGLADVDSGLPVDADTRFYIASSSKALTATAVVRLAEAGILDLQAPVTQYLPALRFGEGIRADEVTVHDLLSMTEGLADEAPVIFRTAYSGEFTPGQLIDLLADYDAAESGRAFDYSNLPYNILGLVLDAVDDGQLEPGGWKAPVREAVLDPLGMRETTALVSGLEANRIAMPHALAPSGRFERIRLAKADANLHAAGGHFSSARSLARFVAAHVSGGTLEGRRAISQEVIKSSHRRHAEQDRSFGPFQRDGWGYGWDLAEWNGRRLIQRFGGFAGYYAHMSFMPEHRIGVVVLSNGVSGMPAADLVALYAYDRLLGREDLEAEYDAQFDEIEAIHRQRAEQAGQALAERAQRLEPLPRELSAYAGRYRNDSIGTMHWQVVAGGLELSMGVAHSRAEIFDASGNLLRVALTGGGTVVRFEFADGEKATAVTWNGEVFSRLDP